MARAFNGTSDFARVAAAPVTAMPLTIAAWFNPTALATGWIVDISDETANPNEFALELEASGALRAFIREPGVSAAAATSVSYAVNAWNAGMAVFASSSSITAYLNGGSSTTSNPGITPSGLAAVDIGKRGGVNNSFFGGALRGVALWNAALGPVEAMMHAAGVSPLFIRPDALVAYFELDGEDAPEFSTNNGLWPLTFNGTAFSALDPLLWTRSREWLDHAAVSSSGGGNTSTPLSHASFPYAARLLHELLNESEARGHLSYTGRSLRSALADVLLHAHDGYTGRPFSWDAGGSTLLSRASFPYLGEPFTSDEALRELLSRVSFGYTGRPFTFRGASATELLHAAFPYSGSLFTARESLRLVNPKTDIYVRPYTRQTAPASAEALPAYLLREFQKLQATLTSLTSSSPATSDTAPLVPLNGMIRYAVGAWAIALGGEGFYGYKNGSWVRLA